MDNLIKELKKIFLFKADTRQGDIVLIVAEKPQTMLYALITDIARDVSKRDEWWHVTLHFLTLPPQKVIWTMREPQFTGKEVFTMGGEKRFIQALEFYGTDGPKSGRKSTDGLRKRPTLRVVK